MELKITATPKEIADLVKELQGQPCNNEIVNSALKELTVSLSGVLEDMQ